MLTSAALLLAAVGSATAQFAGGLNYTTSGPLNVTASQISQNMRNIWCSSQETVCRELCGETKTNNCDATTLAYDCQCAKGATPNISAYEQSMPFFICTYWIANCVDNHPNDFSGIAGCRSVVCGTKNASAVHNSNGGPSSSTSSAAGGASSSTSSPKSTHSSAGGSQSSTTTSSSSTSSGNMAAATKFAASYGTQILAGGMLAAFGLAL